MLFRSASEFARELQPGQTVEIMTGAPVPPGADAVVMLEYTRREAGAVVVERSAAVGENIVPAGAEARRGQVVLKARTRLGPAHMAVAAAVGVTQIAVYRRPRVAILATGDEIVEAGAQPGPSQIRNSNSYSLAAQVEAAGGEAVILDIAPDQRQPLRRLLAEGLAADLLLVSGGVSAGKYDLAEEVLGEFGAQFFFTGALIQPGRPIVFGRAAPRPGAPPAYFFGLPGNPVSTLVCFDLFARAILEALAGAEPQPLQFLHARLGKEIRTRTGLTRFLPGLLSGALDQVQVELASWQGSGDMVAAARANCWVVIPPDRNRIPEGEWVAVLPR